MSLVREVLERCKKGSLAGPHNPWSFPVLLCVFYVQDCFTIGPQCLSSYWFMCFPLCLRFFPWPSLIFSSVFLHSSHSSIFHHSFNPHVSNHFFFCRFVTFSCVFPWHLIFPSLWVLTFQLSRRGAALGTRCSWRWSLEVAWWCLGIRWCHLWHPMQCHLVPSKESWNLKAKQATKRCPCFSSFLFLFFRHCGKNTGFGVDGVDGVNHWG